MPRRLAVIPALVIPSEVEGSAFCPRFIKTLEADP
jgi:hypothetical protein